MTTIDTTTRGIAEHLLETMRLLAVRRPEQLLARTAC